MAVAGCCTTVAFVAVDRIVVAVVDLSLLPVDCWPARACTTTRAVALVVVVVAVPVVDIVSSGRAVYCCCQ